MQKTIKEETQRSIQQTIRSGTRFKDTALTTETTYVPTQKKLTRLEELSLFKKIKTYNVQKYGKKITNIQVQNKKS